MTTPRLRTQIATHLSLVLITIAVLYPVLWVLKMALSPGQAFSLELNPLVFRGYFDLMVKYARLHLLVGHLLSPEGKGKLCLAAYAKAHAIANHVEPRGFLPLARYALDFERALPKLQEDLSNASLRVADALVPMQAKIIALSDANYLKGETVLAPVRPARAPSRL